MKTFRQILFWSHLVAGLIAGLAIAVMCFTGTALAFEKELIAWAERDARRVEPPAANTARLPFDELQRRLRAAQPAAQPTSIVVQNDPRAAVAFTAGRTVSFHVNPYTGEVRQPQSTAMGSFMQTMVTWHRYLGFSGEVSRPRGKLVNGVANLAFCALAVTGLYLWMPRSWSWRGVKAVSVINWRLLGKARDFNWHNAIGLWSAPVLIVLTLTAVPISFQWGGRVINTLTGTPQPTPTPAGGGGGQAAQPPIEVPPPPPGATPLSQDALLAAAHQAVPEWKTITLRIGGAAGGRGEGARGGQGAGAARGGRGARGESGSGRGSRGDAAPASTAVAANAAPSGSTAVNPAIVASATAPAEQSALRTPQPAGAATLPAATFTIRESGSWPRTANTTLTLDPYTGAVLRRTGYADQAPAQRVRAWTRFLHTGEALGWPGQLVAGLACAGGCFLVWTGFALSWRRFFGRKKIAPDAPVA